MDSLTGRILNLRYFKHKEGIKSLKIYTVNTEGKNKRLWWSFAYKLDFWEEGQVSVQRNQDYQV